MSELAKELVIYHRESAARLNADTSATYKSQVDAHNKTANLIEQLQQRITELEAQVPKWISVDDELPENYQWCLISWAGNTDVFLSEFSVSPSGHYWSFTEDGEVWHPAHWMPLLQPPKDKDNE